MEAGQVFFPAEARWLEDLENELLAFPHGRNDDQVDTLAYAALEVTRRSKRRVSLAGWKLDPDLLKPAGITNQHWNS
jgi:phage terminase large subunit-like protein